MSELIKPTVQEGERPSVPLVEALHAVLPEPPEEETLKYFTSSSDGFSKTHSRKNRIQYEIVGDTVLETYRYNPILENDKFDIDEQISTPHNWDWPGLNLYVEKGLAKIVDDMVDLEGRTVVSFRPEYYPFFGIFTAKKGARTILVDSRPIPTVEDLINIGRQYSHDLAQAAEQKWREGVGREDVIAAENQSLLSSTELGLISAVVRSRQHISPEVWDNLTDLERSYYVFEWINENPSFSLAANQYFGGSGSLSVEDKGLFYSIPESQRFPFVLKFVEENFDELMSRETWYVARDLVGERVRQALSPDEEFSMAVEEIYGKLVADKFWNAIVSGKRPSDARIQEAILETLFQSTEINDHERIRTNLNYRYGKELGQADIPDESVDVLFSGWGLDYLENSVDFAANAARILKDDGLFVGYVKKEAEGQERKRNLADPRVLREVLERCGFGEIVIVHKKDFEGGHTNVKDVGYIFFARKAIIPTSSQTGLIPVTDIPDSALFPKAQREEAQISPAPERRPIEKTWGSEVILDGLVDVLKTRPEDIKLITDAIYGPNVTPVSEGDLKNILMGMYCKYADINTALANIPGLSAEFTESMTQYYLKQEQVDFLLKDLNEAFLRINRFEDTSDIEETIRLRAEVLGTPDILVHFQRMKGILASTELSQEVRAMLDKAQEEVRKAYSQDPGHPWVYENAFGENIILFTSLERRRQLGELVKALSDYFLEYGLSFHIRLDDKSTIQASIGRVHKVAIYDYLDREHQVYFVDQTISIMDKNTQALYAEGSNGADERKFVFLDRVEGSAKLFVDRLRWFEDVPILIRQEWGDLKDQGQIIRDIIEHSSIHEIQHTYGTGELGSYLAELAFGPTPYYDLYTKVTMLYELADDKHMGGFSSNFKRIRQNP